MAAYGVIALGGLAGIAQGVKTGAAHLLWIEFVVASLFAVALLGLHRWDRALAAHRLVQPLAACGRMC